MNIATLVITAASLVGSLASAQSVVRDDVRFHQIFMNEARLALPQAKPEDLAHLHFIADAPVLKALGEASIDAALKDVATSDLTALVRATETSATCAPLGPLSQKPLTLVIVPGVFAEFIKNHAFEEVFERPSALRDQFATQVAAERVSDEVSIVGQAPGQESLDKLVLTGQIEVAGQTVRVILFQTEFASLESLGSSQERAVSFNNRLEKYLALTGPQDLALIGYSRGTVTGLEMLAQAQAAGRPWISSVKAMISLSGVNFGSTLADDALNTSGSPGAQILARLNRTVQGLKLINPSGSRYVNWVTVRWNTRAWLGFLKAAATDFAKMNQGKSLTDVVVNLRGALSTDPRAPLGIVVQMYKELGLTNPVGDYNGNIVRFRYFVAQLLASVNELSSGARALWWSTHSVPKSVTYYAITAAMADAQANPLEAELFANPFAYGNGSYDDVGLAANHADYTRLSGVVLNDSQVSVPQAAFLPEVIARLNPANAGLSTKFLGIAGTHHWGMALREVNKMQGGQKNGFPREAMLKALATQVKLDTAN